MVAEAARLLDGTGWLPPLLRTVRPGVVDEVSPEAGASAAGGASEAEAGTERAADAA